MTKRIEEVADLRDRLPTSPDLEIAKMLILSTHHISEGTNQAFEDNMGDDGLPTFFPKGEYGWFIYVPQRDDDIDEECPADLAGLLRFARENGCEWLTLDRDGNTIDGLHTYEW